MADTTPQTPPASSYGMPLTIHSQYVKDLSFENPGAPAALRPATTPPDIDVDIYMDAKRLQHERFPFYYEVTLTLNANARRDGKTIFIAQILYAAAVSVTNVPEEKHQPLLLIEVPKILFPFIRHLLSELTQQAGYPPLLITPVDFNAMYMSQFRADKKA